MPALPTPLASEIFSNLFHFYSLYCCELDKNTRIVNMWGDNKFYGFDDWHLGQELSNEDFLLGMVFNETWIMRDVQVAVDNHADIYFSPNIKGKRYLVFISTQHTVGRRREIQQRGNQLTLLHERNKKLITQLEESQSSLTDSNTDLSNFIASMSHEFRTPLTSITGYAQLISDQAGLPASTIKHLSYIESASQHLLALVENLLDQTQLNTDNFQLQRTSVSIDELATEVTAVMASLASAKGLAFSASMSEHCVKYASLDGLRTRQILINLLGNAIKFTDEGEVKLLIDSSESEIILVVTDSGPGIPPHMHESIFEAYQRSNMPSTKPGAGLGLNITKRLVEKMEGTISLLSNEGTGAQFTIRLPYIEADENFVLEHTQPVPILILPSDNAVFSLLLVEDNEDISNLLKIFLNRAGYKVEIAENGQIALDKSRMHDYDAIITDLHMPILGGKELVKLLRKEGYKKPVIALTASEKKSEQEQMLQEGFTLVLTKPIQVPELMHKLAYALKSAAKL